MRIPNALPTRPVTPCGTWGTKGSGEVQVGDHTVSQEQPPHTTLPPEFQLQHVMLGAPPSAVEGPTSERLNKMLAALEELALPGGWPRP